MRLMPSRRAGLAVIITLGVVAAAVALTGTVIAASSKTHPAKFKAPLLIYPVSQASPGQCPPGTHGITGPGTAGMTCYQVTQGIAIRRVSDIHVQSGSGGYDVSISLLPSDSKSFAALTRRMAGGGSLALVVRNHLVTAPRVQEPITEGKILITGSPSRAEADRLVRELKGTGQAQQPVITTPPTTVTTPAQSCTPSPTIGTPSAGTPTAGTPTPTPSAGTAAAGTPVNTPQPCPPSPATGAPSSLAPTGAIPSGTPSATIP